MALNDILEFRPGAGEKPQPWLQTPDGRWVAYRSNESGRAEVYVQGYPERRGKWPVSQAGGIFPHWRADGRELYWTGMDGLLMAAPVTAGPAGIETGKPTPVFRVPTTVTGWFEPERDGRRFLVAEPAGGPERELPMVVVQNWPALLGGKP
jgi:hypothetical protein